MLKNILKTSVCVLICTLPSLPKAQEANASTLEIIAGSFVTCETSYVRTFYYLTAPEASGAIGSWGAAEFQFRTGDWKVTGNGKFRTFDFDVANNRLEILVERLGGSSGSLRMNFPLGACTVHSPR